VRLSTLVHSPLALKNRQRVRLHHYTTEVEARLVFPDVEHLEPGESAPAQLRTAAPIVPAAGDRFVVRALSPSVTLGGGVVINPRGIKLKARSAELFTRLDEQDDPGIVEALVKSAGLKGATKKELVGLSGLPPKRLDKVLEKLKSAQTLIRIDQAEDRLIHAYYLDILHNRVVRRLEKFHVEQPLKEGMPKQQLRSHVPGSDKLFRRLMEILTGQKVVVDLGDAVRAPSHTVHLKEEEEDVKESLRHAIIQGHASPPTFKALVAQSGGDAKQVRTLLGLLERDNLVVKAKEDLYFSRAFIDEIKAKLTAFITEHGGITPSQFNELTRSSRKYNIPLLEYLDRERFTMRVGDQRVLRGSATSAGGGRAE
jgi:selenocysteine-specific elongation factor